MPEPRSNPLYALASKLRDIDSALLALEDRLSVIEDATINHESRLQDLEEREDERDE
jgi:uncharacterized Rmd1/YagE family protein